MMRLFRLSQGRQFSRCGCAFTPACGSGVRGFGLGVVGRVETLPYPVLATAEWLRGASESVMVIGEYLIECTIMRT